MFQINNIRLLRFTSIFSLGLVLLGCSETETRVSEPNSPRPVKLIDVGAANDESRLRFPAVIGAANNSDLSFLVSGRVEDVLVTEAQDIQEGQVLARLETRDYENQVSSLLASFDIAEEEYQRALRLLEQDAIAKSVVEQRKAQRDVATAQLDSAKKALSDSVLTAPFTGVVASISIRKTEAVSAGASAITIIDVSSLEATINLPASIVAQVPSREDQGALVILDSAPDAPIQAVFKEANLAGDATSQTYRVTFAFSAPEQLLVLPGMNATVFIQRTNNGDSRGAVNVPLAAVQSDASGEFVWLLDEADMTVSRQQVAIEPGIGDNAAISSGLKAGDRIVGAGGAYITEGAKVSEWQ